MIKSDKTYILENGNANIDLPELEAGDYKMYLTFTPDDPYYTTVINREIDLNITKKNTKISLLNTTVTSNDSPSNTKRQGLKISVTSDSDPNHIQVDGTLYIFVNMALQNSAPGVEPDDILIKTLEIKDYQNRDEDENGASLTPESTQHVFFHSDFDWDAIQTEVNDKLGCYHSYRKYYLKLKFVGTLTNEKGNSVQTSFMDSELSGSDVYMNHTSVATVAGFDGEITVQHGKTVNKTITLKDDLGNGIKGAPAGWKIKKYGTNWDTYGHNWGENPLRTDENGTVVFKLGTDGYTDDLYEVRFTIPMNAYYLPEGISYYTLLHLTKG